jgi:hypothetical protein
MRHGDIIERLSRGGATAEAGATIEAAGVAVAPLAATQAVVAGSGADPDAAERAVFGIDFSPASLGAARWIAAHLQRAGDPPPVLAVECGEADTRRAD